MTKNACTICGGVNWISMDHIRNHDYWWERNELKLGAKVGFQVCQSCGFITYANIADAQGMQKHYTEERKVVSAQHHATCGRKNAMHRAFLGERIAQWISEGRTLMDVGCAQGFFLNMLVERYGWPKDKLLGTEWAANFAKFATEIYGLNVMQNPPEGQKWDIISLYRVLEHMKDPAKELASLREKLSERGIMYISVPIWLDILEDPPGGSAKDFENVFHLNHVNVFTWQSFANLLAKVGLKVIQEDRNMYQCTVLLEKCEPSGKIIAENPADIKRDLELCKKACEFLKEDKPAEAIACWRRFPEAWVMLSFHHENMRDPIVSEQVLRQALEVMPNHWRLHQEYGNLLFRIGSPPFGSRGMTPQLETAREHLLKAIKLKPGLDNALSQLGMIEAVYAENFQAALEFWKELLYMNPMAFRDVWDRIGACLAGQGQGVPVQTRTVLAPPQKPRDDIQMITVPGMERMQLDDASGG